MELNRDRKKMGFPPEVKETKQKKQNQNLKRTSIETVGGSIQLGK